MQDFDSAGLKNKKHWNSFTTPFFIELHTVIAQLQNKGRLDINVSKAESMLKQDLVCHLCHKTIKNILGNVAQMNYPPREARFTQVEQYALKSLFSPIHNR